MAIFLALPKLYDAVVARLAAEAPLVGDPPAPGPPIATSYFGWREPAKQYPGNRLVWVPGEPSGAIGEIVAPRMPGNRQTGRPFTNLEEKFHVFVTGYDAAAPTIERAQYVATRLLFDELVRCIHLAAFGNYAIKSASWVIDKKEFRAGATILLNGTIRAVQPDHENDSAPVDTGAIVDIEVLDVTEELRVPEDHIPGP